LKQHVAQATSTLLSAEADATAAKVEYDRIQLLANTGSVTAKARDEAQARYEAGAAKVAEAKAGIATAKAEVLASSARETEAAATLEYTRIVAPFGGLVVERNAELGDYLGPDSKRANLFTVEQTDTLRIRMHIPEHAASLAGKGDPVTVQLAGREFVTKLIRVSGSLDPVTRTMTAEAELSDPELIPGTFGTAILKTASLEKALIVPAAALKTTKNGSPHVLVQEAGQTKTVPVTIFAVEGTQAILSSGPEPGANVILP